MTAPEAILNQSTAALAQTLNGASQTIGGTIRLAFLVPALACVLLAEALVTALEWISRTPALARNEFALSPCGADRAPERAS
jgi:hypothetical protein